MHGFAVLAVVSTSGLHLHQHGGATRTCGLGASAARRSRLWPRMVAGGDSYDTNEVVLAARKGKTEALSALLAADRAAANTAVACAKIPTMDGATPIIWAARQGKLEAVQLLLSNAADVNAAAQSGWTALYAAALNGHENIVTLLVSNDASVAAAMGLGDERTNLNLRRMLREAYVVTSVAAPAQQQQLAASTAAYRPAAPASAVPAAAMPSSVWDSVARATAEVTPAPAPPMPASGASSGALTGLGELGELRLRQEWRAPPTPEEQALAPPRSPHLQPQP